MEQRFFGISDWRDILIVIVLAILGLGTLLPVFILGLFLGFAVEEKAESPLLDPKIKEYKLPENSPMAQNIISWDEIGPAYKSI